MGVLERLSTSPINTNNQTSSGVLARLNKSTSTGTGVLNRLNKKKTTGSDYLKESLATGPEFVEAITHPIESAGKVASTFGGEVMGGLGQAGEGLKEVATGNIPEKIAGAANVALGGARTVFSGLTTAFKVAEHIPVVKNVADAINVIIGGVGKIGYTGVNKAIGVIPESIISKETKDIILEPLSELGSLAAQIALGELLLPRVVKAVKDYRKVTPEVAKKLVVEAKDEYSRVQLTTPKTKFAEYSKKQGYEPVVPEELLPTIEMGAKAKESLPVIQTDIKTPTVKGEFTYEPIKPIIPVETKVPSQVEAKVEYIPEPIIKTPKVEYKEIPKKEPIIDEPMAKRVYESYVEEHKITDPGELLSLKQQARKMVEIAEANYPKVSEMVLQRERFPGIEEGIAFEGVAQKAKMKGDWDMISKLARVKEEAGTQYGKGLQAFQTEQGFENPILKTINTIREVRRHLDNRTIRGQRVADLKVKDYNEISKRFDEKVKKAKPGKESLTEFINSIKCD